MALAASLVTLLIYVMIPTIFAASTYSRSSLDIAETNEQSRKFGEIDFPPKHANLNEQSSTTAERKLDEVDFPLNSANPNELSSRRAGRKLKEIDFPIDLGEDFYSSSSVPVIAGLARRYPNARRISAVNRSRKPYGTVPVRQGIRGTSKGTQHIADIENELLFSGRNPVATSSSVLRLKTRLRQSSRLPAGPFVDDNGFEQ